MEILLLIAVPMVMVWGCVWVAKFANSGGNLLAMLAMCVVFAGCVLGPDFFSFDRGPVPITIDRVLLAGLAALFGVMWFRGVERPGPFNRVDLVILGLVVVIGMSTFTHDWRYHEKMPVSRLLFFYIVPVTLYFVVRSTRLGVADLKWMYGLFGGLGIYLALTAIAETRGMSAVIFPRYIMTSSTAEFFGRGRGPFLNPVSNGIFMVTGLCALWTWLPASRQRVKVLIVVGAGVMALGIFCTLTRSVWLGLILAFGLYVWYPATRQLKGGMIIAATLLLIVTFPLVGEKIFSFKRDKQVTQAEMEQSAQLRPLFVIVAMNMFADRPLLGCGFGQYARAKYPYLQDPYSGRPVSVTRSYFQHNIFLAYLTETGLAGLSVLLAMLVAMTSVGWSLWKDLQLETWARRLGLLMLVLLANYGVNGMFHDVSITPMSNTLLFFMFGLVNNVATNRARFEIVDVGVAEADCDSQRGTGAIAA